MSRHPHVVMLPAPAGAEIVGLLPVPGRTEEPVRRLPNERLEQMLVRARQAMRGAGVVLVRPLLRGG
ncbi:hypothetical protein JI739_07750 [Ramlibacter sp. AW1]|uniref:Uncharacterized protein n=1 Tax=Ramlibacter aurantiacus TaxID=2801330 RepID=A0A936ZET7_9BURK|nr:hypothetical protein [Ramlibacter aurantiacus]MBL0420234.1 hypothetical protein [Ramlibacter aurantiacus]